MCLLFTRRRGVGRQWRVDTMYSIIVPAESKTIKRLINRTFRVISFRREARERTLEFEILQSM